VGRLIKVRNEKGQWFYPIGMYDIPSESEMPTFKKIALYINYKWLCFKEYVKRVGG
jgi:hypothetical protein